MKPRLQLNAPPDPAAGQEILTCKQVAAWLQVNERQVERLGVPRLQLGHKTIRYLRSDVLAWLEQQRERRPRAS